MDGGNETMVNTYVELILWDVLECAGVRLEVLGQDAHRSTCHHLGQKEGLVLREGTVVEDEQELAPLVESLNAVRNARREEPHIARTNIVDISRTILIYRGNTHAALEHQRPLVGRVPVKFTVGVGS